MAALVGFPAYERYFRGSYDKAAQAIIARADGIPIYSVDDTSVRLSIVANINALRAPASPVTRPPPQFESGFVLSLKSGFDYWASRYDVRDWAGSRRNANPLSSLSRQSLLSGRHIECGPVVFSQIGDSMVN